MRVSRRRTLHFEPAEDHQLNCQAGKRSAMVTYLGIHLIDKSTVLANLLLLLFDILFPLKSRNAV